MRRISAEELRETTLRRQFPIVDGRDAAAVLALFDHLGPIQSQVPRAPFVAVSSRLPGVPYEVVRTLFTEHHLLKTTNIRGTVHTSTPADFVRLDAASRRAREPSLRRELRLDPTGPAALTAEIERYASGEWRDRSDLVEHATAWLAERGSTFDSNAFSGSLLWGHSGLIRRPKDEAWEKRTDRFHRTAADVVELAPLPEPTAALADLSRVHLRAYGPLTRADLAFFFGVGLREVDAALALLGDEVVSLTGPDHQPLLDLAEPPPAGEPEPGLRLLPEYDGLLVGYAGPNRTRFARSDHLAQIWARVNGVFSPVVLADGRLVATWKTVATGGRRADLAITMLPGESPLAEDSLLDQVRALGTVLDLTIGDVRIGSAR
jgi:hypothetical protein